MMKRLKVIKRREFETVFVEENAPVFLEGDAMPEFARGIPDAVRCCVIASGQHSNAVPYAHPQLPDAQMVGGIDVWRNSPDDPDPFNKDWYAVIASSSTPDLLYIDGPKRDSEHWRPEIPERYTGAKIIKGGDEEDQ